MFLKVAYKQKHDAAKGFSDYAHMKEPPDIKHAMEVNKHQSNVRTPSLMIFWEIVVTHVRANGYVVEIYILQLSYSKRLYNSFFFFFKSLSVQS